MRTMNGKYCCTSWWSVPSRRFSSSALSIDMIFHFVGRLRWMPWNARSAEAAISAGRPNINSAP
jgi:hypothetical protein